MKTFLIASSFMCCAVFSTAQNLPCLNLQSVSVEYKLIPQYYSNLGFEEITRLAKDPSAFTPIDLSTYHNGVYSFSRVDNGNILFRSPEPIVNSNGILSYSRFGIKCAFGILNHKTNEYRNNRELVFGIFYQPYLYHQNLNGRTDTITQDSLHFSYAYYDEWSPVAGAEAAYLFTIQPLSWVIAYAGLGVGAGAALHPQVAETFGLMSGKIIHDSTGIITYPSYTFYLLTNEQNFLPAKQSVLLEGKIPFGLHFIVLNDVSLFLQGEIVGLRQIYFSGSSPYPFHISCSGSAGLRVNL